MSPQLRYRERHSFETVERLIGCASRAIACKLSATLDRLDLL